MKQHQQRLFAALVSMALLLSLGGMGMAVADYTAPPSIDTSGSDDTSTASDLTDGDTINVTRDGSSSNWTAQYIAATNNSEFRLENEENGNQTVVTNSSPETVLWNTTDNDGHFNVTVEESSLLATDHTINENVTLGARFVNDTTNDTEVTGHATIYAEFGNNSSVRVIGDDEVDEEDIVTVEESDRTVPLTNLAIPTLGVDQSTIETESRSVDGTNTEVALVLDNSSVADDYDSAVSSAESSLFGLSSSSVEDGTPLWRAPTTLSGGDTQEPLSVPVFYEEAPDAFPEDDRTYGVYTEDYANGETAVVYHLGENNFEDADEVEITADGGVGLTDGLMHGVSVDSWDGMGPAILG